MIGVVVNGLGGSLYIDSADGTTPVESIVIRDLIPHIDATYCTDPQRRVLEGFSMGGYGATHLAFKYVSWSRSHPGTITCRSTSL